MASIKLCFFCLVFLIPAMQGQQGIPGGAKEISVNDERVSRWKDLALAEINGKGTNKEVVEVKKVTTQVVAGTLTKLILVVKEKDYQEICKVSIWEKPWENFVEVQNETCNAI